MNNYIMAIILIPTYILLSLLGRRFLKFAHGYEKGLEDAEKIRKMEEKRLLDEIRAEIEQDAFKDVNGSKYIFVNRVNQILDKYKVESEDKEYILNKI